MLIVETQNLLISLAQLSQRLHQCPFQGGTLMALTLKTQAEKLLAVFL